MVEKDQELQVEEPKTEVKEKKTNVDDLIAELEKVGIESPQQLQGKLEASAQTGKAFQMLGDERKRVEELEEEVARLKSQPKQDDWDLPMDGRPVDIEAAIEKSINRVLTKKEQQARQAQEASVQAYNMIKTDPNYHLVGEIWEAKVKDPAYIYQVQTGQVDPVRDYQKTVVDYYQNIAKQSLETIKEMQEGVKQPAPHVETGETRSPGNIVSDDKAPSANRQFLDAIRKKIAGGYVPTDDENALIAEAVLMESVELP